MNLSLSRMFVALVLFPLATQAVPTAPTIPTTGVDAKLMNNQTPQAFFAARKNQTACRGELTTLKAAYVAEKEGLAKLLGTSGLDAIDAQGARMEKSRDTWLEKVSECGNCASQPMELRKIASAGRTEYWYIADGSCLVDGPNANGLLASYIAKKDSLLTADAYRHYAGGFPTVLDYHFIDPATGQKQNLAKQTGAAPFFSFIAIRGPVIAGMQASFGYVFKNEVAETQNNGVTEFSHTFQAERVDKFTYPNSVQQHLPSGRQRRAQLLKLSRVQGKFFLNSEGYIRYYTAADLGMDLEYAKKLAQNILLTTLESMYERGVGEAP